MPSCSLVPVRSGSPVFLKQGVELKQQDYIGEQEACSLIHALLWTIASVFAMLERVHFSRLICGSVAGRYCLYLYLISLRLPRVVSGKQAHGEDRWPDHRTQKLDHIEKYEVTYPRWISPEQSRSSFSDKVNSYQHPLQAEVGITAEGRELVLQLEQNSEYPTARRSRSRPPFIPNSACAQKNGSPVSVVMNGISPSGRTPGCPDGAPGRSRSAEHCASGNRHDSRQCSADFARYS
ncbi:hypothetical protein COCON_G00040380 [Conger conger]|uniref:Uncharacterized protein n=1 Tax=Conger conger TaxID=82655 RepID=A0A9Q1I3T8_CONCO|nr:hypothetical protein COCON_G00040380 [Conger conger]